MKFVDPEIRLSDGASFSDSIRARGELKEAAIAYERTAELARRQTINKAPLLKPLLKQREEWLERQVN